MSESPLSPPVDLRILARSLAGTERDLSREARALAEQGDANAPAWFGLVERAAVALRRASRDLEGVSEPPALLATTVRPRPAFLTQPAPQPALPKEEPREAAQPAAALRYDPTEPPLASSEGVLAGHASVVPVSELLGFLSGLRKSGMLWVETPRESFLVQLQDGAVVYAQGDNPPQGQLLGEVLVDAHAISRETLERALVSAAKEQEVLGAFLVREGLISHEDLSTALGRQAQMIFDRMFGSLDASWQFEDGVRMVDSADVRLNVIQLLLESARASDESRMHIEMDVAVPLARAD